MQELTTLHPKPTMQRVAAFILEATIIATLALGMAVAILALLNLLTPNWPVN